MVNKCQLSLIIIIILIKIRNCLITFNQKKRTQKKFNLVIKFKAKKHKNNFQLKKNNQIKYYKLFNQTQ